MNGAVKMHGCRGLDVLKILGNDFQQRSPTIFRHPFGFALEYRGTKFERFG